MNYSSKQASQMINDKRDELVKMTIDLQYNMQSDIWKKDNHVQYSYSIRDAGYHFSYLSEALAAGEVALFLDYVGWVKVLFSGLNFSPKVLITTLECMDQAMNTLFPAGIASITNEFINIARKHLDSSPIPLGSFLIPGAPQYELASQYFKSLLAGDRHSASDLIMNAVNNGMNVKDIYLHVFQPCQQEVGRLWQMNQVSVAQEHFNTVVTQMIISQLYPKIFSSRKNGRRVIATSVGGELHEIGMRMVADFLEMDGWDTYYLGANTPNESILRSIDEKKADILAISATIPFHVSAVAELIERVRVSPKFSKLKIMVGGYPFNISTNLWKHVGADSYAKDAQDAISIANQLAGEIS